MSSLRDRLLKQKEDLKNRSSGGQTFSIKEGTTRFRILPTGDENDWAKEITYFFLGKDLGGIISPNTYGKKCAIMQAATKFKESKSEDDREWAKNNLRPSRKFAVVAAKYKDEKGKEMDLEASPKLLLLTSSQYQELLEMWLDEELGDFTDTQSGYDIKFSRTGKGKMDTEYTMRRCDRSPLHKALKKKAPYDLEGMIKEIMPSYDKTKEIINQFLNADADKLDEEEDTPKKKSSSSDKKKKKSKSKDL